MSEEAAFLSAIRDRHERGDPRGAFVRLHTALLATAPDHVQRPAAEAELSRLRLACARDWLAAIETERAHLYADPPARPDCRCFVGLFYPEDKKALPPPELHAEPQDTECGAWKRLCEVVERAADDGRAEFAPLRELQPGDREHIVTLPPTIARLKRVRRFVLYGSHLVRIPPEIGEMDALEAFEPYTSYRLHWFPYEITRCKRLNNSRVSTRALFGNYKYHPPFPRLTPGAFAGRAEPRELPLACGAPTVRACSVCAKPFEDRREHRVWVTLGVGTDALPLLVNACSEGCVRALPKPLTGYTNRPHRGGTSRQQQHG